MSEEEIGHDEPGAFNRGHHFEFMDRVHIAENYVDMALGDHPMLETYPSLKELYARVSESLAEMYQQVGRMEETWE